MEGLREKAELLGIVRLVQHILYTTFVPLRQQGVCSPVSVPHPAMFYVDPTLHMSHGSGQQLLRVCLIKSNGRQALRTGETNVCVGVLEHVINFVLLSFPVSVDNGPSLSRF